jgi:O-antigen/teichoic acid export membrane protein
MILGRHLLTRLARDHDLQDLLRGSSWASLLKVAAAVVGYLFTLSVTRSLGANAWGTFSLAWTVFTVGAVLGSLGIDTALVRLVAEYRGRNQQVVSMVFARAVHLVIPAALAVSAVSYFAAEGLASGAFHKPYLAQYFRLGSLAILPISLGSLVAASLRGLKRIKEFAFFQQVAPDLFCILLLLAILPFHRHVGGVLSAYILGCYLVLIVSWSILAKDSSFRSPNVSAELGYSVILSIALPMVFASTMMFVKGWIDNIMVGIFMHEADVGVYDVAFKLANFASFSLVPVNAIAAPKFAELYGRRDIIALGKLAQQSTQLIMLSSLPILLAILVAPRFLLGFFGPEFTAGAVALTVLASGRFVSAACGPVAYLLQMTGHQTTFRNVIVAVTVMAVLLNYLLIPPLGILGAALSTFAAVIIQNIVFVLYIRRKFGFLTVYYPFKRG